MCAVVAMMEVALSDATCHILSKLGEYNIENKDLPIL